ncbi:uncharacterized protein VNE69_01313 [Vairimorpha necatrix]|uniref:Uncharacterized protein n=1 Tax=Vairimorpha necatrix TaxID=6039 RepID=A0AAX4J8V8_9MICR
MIEAETYIEENNYIDDKLFMIIMEINKFFSEKNKTDSETSISEKKVNLLNLFEKIVIVHNDIINTFKEELITKIYKTVALFTGYNSINVYEYEVSIFSEIHNIEKEAALGDLKLDGYMIEKNMKEIKEKFQEQNKEAVKTKYKIPYPIDYGLGNGFRLSNIS